MDINVINEGTVRVDQVIDVTSMLELEIEWADDYHWFEIVDVSVVITDDFVKLLPSGLLDNELEAAGVIEQIVEYARQCREEGDISDVLDAMEGRR